MKQTAIVLHILLALALTSAAPAVAEDDVTVQVTSIAASMEKAPPVAARGVAESKVITVDPKLAGFRKKLGSLFAYSRYAFLGKARSKTSFGGVSSFALPERFSLEVEPQRVEVADDEERIEMLVTLFRQLPARPATRGEGDVDSERPRAPAERGVDSGRPQREIVLRTRIRLENGGTVLLGGPPIKDGVLILALTARR